VIAGIAGDLAGAIEAQGGGQHPSEASDRADVWRRFEAVLTAEGGLASREAA